MQFLQKYENVEKTFWKRWLCERVFFENASKTFWKRCAIREVFFHTPTKTFWKRWLSRLFFATFPETLWKRSMRFFKTLEKRIENEKTLGTFLRVAGRTKTKKTGKNEMETAGAFSRGCRSSLCAAFSSCEAYENAMKTYENASKTQWKRIENVIHSKFPPNRVFKNAQDVLKTFWAFLKFFGGPFENAKYVLKRPPRFQESFRDFFFKNRLKTFRTF